jgi:methionyl-tRNA formyltransferase
MGTDKFAVPALRAIIKSEVELVCVITQPDKPKGRQLKLAASPIKEVALENNLVLHQPGKVRDRQFIEDVLKPAKPDIIVVAAFGQILPKDILELPPLGCINLHPSLLPKYRGAAPIQRAIINGEKQTGITVMFMDEGEDTGDIIIQKSVEIDIMDTAEDLLDKLADLGAELILETFKLAQQDALPRKPQQGNRASYAPKLKKEDGQIDWSKSAFEIHNLIRGTVPWPGAYTKFRHDIHIKIWESRPIKLSAEELNPIPEPGIVTEIIPEEGILVATGVGSLLLRILQPASKSRMNARDFVNGYRVSIGDMFT